MPTSPVRTLALLTPDPELKKAFAGPLAADCSLDLQGGRSGPLNEVEAAAVDGLVASEVEFVVVDIAAQPAIGMRLAEFLVKANPAWFVLVVDQAREAERQAEALRRALRIGVLDYLTKPVDAEALRESLDRARTKPGAERPESPMEGSLYAVMGARGGVGATTVVASLAEALAADQPAPGEPVCALDLDRDGAALALAWGLKPKFDFQDAVANLHRMDPSLLESFSTVTDSGIHVFAAPEDLAAVKSPEPARYGPLLELMRHQYRWLVADLPGPTATVVPVVLKQTTAVLLVVDDSIVALRNVRRLVPRIRGLADEPDLPVHLVFNRHRGARSLSDREVEKAVHLPVYAHLPHAGGAVHDAWLGGRPLTDGAFGRAIVDVATRLTGRIRTEPGWRDRLPRPFRKDG